MWSPVHPTSQQIPPPSAKSGRSSTHGATIFGKSLVIKGDMSGSEPLQIEGRVEGSIAILLIAAYLIMRALVLLFFRR